MAWTMLLLFLATLVLAGREAPALSDAK
jgi:hypothetical protein